MNDDLETVAIAVLVGVVIGLCGVGFMVQTWTKPMIVERVRYMQILRDRGVCVTMDSQTNVWVWDDRHRTSYKADTDMLKRIIEEAR